jgi:hypothetical protein
MLCTTTNDSLTAPGDSEDEQGTEGKGGFELLRIEVVATEEMEQNELRVVKAARHVSEACAQRRIDNNKIKTSNRSQSLL